MRISRLGCIVVAILITSALAANASIVAHYTFDEASGPVAHDSAGSVNGAVNGSASFVSGGISGNCITVTGTTNGLVNMGNNFGNLPSDPAGFTLAIWVKNADGTGQIPVSKHNNGTQDGFLVHQGNINTGTGSAADNKAAAYVSSSGSGEPISSAVVNNNQWHQLVETYVPGGLISLYVDGAFQSSKSAETYVPTSSPFIVGGVGETNGNSTPLTTYAGLIDDVQLYNTALSATDIGALFASPGSVVPEPTSLACIATVGMMVTSKRRRSSKGVKIQNPHPLRHADQQ